MNTKTLFNDFKMYVDAMNAQDIKDNIVNAIEHTLNSYILNEQSDIFEVTEGD